jgi:hypothetical protein
MPDVLNNISLSRRPVRLRVGLFAGAVLGPLIGCTLFLLPSNSLLDAYPWYMESFVILIEFFGLCAGLLIGLTIAVLAERIQQWSWATSERVVPNIESPPSATSIGLQLNVMQAPSPMHPPDDRFTRA